MADPAGARREDEGTETSGVVVGPVFVVGAKIEAVVGDEAKHQAIAEESQAAEHAARHRIQRRKKIEKMVPEFGTVSHGRAP